MRILLFFILSILVFCNNSTDNDQEFSSQGNGSYYNEDVVNKKELDFKAKDTKYQKGFKIAALYMETRKAKSIEEVERIVNTKGLNNIDLNNDGEIDYIHITKLSGFENQGRTLEFYVLDGKERINIVKAKYKVSTQNKSGEAVSSSNEAKYNFEDIPKSDEIAEGQLVCYLIIYTKEHPVVIEDEGFTIRSCVLGNYAKEVTDTTKYETSKDSQLYRRWVPWAVVGTSVFVGAVGVYHMRSYWRHHRRAKKTEGVDSKKTNLQRKNYMQTSPVRPARRSNKLKTQRTIRTTEGVRSSKTKSRTRSTRSRGK